MNDPSRDGSVRFLLLVAAAAGPTAAAVHEFDVIPLGPAASLWPLLVIAGTAALGIFLGLKFSRRELRGLGWLAVMSNGIVLCFYVFLLLFFGLGGSR